MPYDGKFIFGEVNGDRINWCVHKDGSMEATKIDKKVVGKFISTKKAKAVDDREDLTNNYKYPDGKITALLQLVLNI